MRKYLASVVLIIFAAIGLWNYGYIIRNTFSQVNDNGIKYISKVDSKNFHIYSYGKWNKEFIKGVNIGAAKPGSFPGELDISKEDYKRWLKYIGDMNVNSIRVYTILKPAFYEALYEYNKDALHPIYLFQGLWVNEDDIAKTENAQDPKIENAVKADIKSLVDIIHGNAKVTGKKGTASGTYTKDVSPYVIGWILGIEWDPNFVTGTDEKNKNDFVYNGKYLYTENASPFEKFLCETGDYAIDYETSAYSMQRPVSFTNWVTTDMLSHPNEPLVQEDMVTVNTEHIKKKGDFKPGLFASYHIYPYYPDSMNYQKEYAKFKDSNGKINTYKAYLQDLIKQHTVPVLAAEFGVPASRGKAHENINTGFNQGDLDETTQGEMDASMLQDIYDEGYCGGIVFTWQDEWFKKTWNTMELDIADRRPYWSNTQTNEQEFGVLAFDPGEKESVSYVDGDAGEWKSSMPVSENKDFKLYVKSDEKYVYLYANIKSFDISKNKFIISVDITPNSGNTFIKDTDIQLSRPADFLITVEGRENSRITVDANYDSFYYIYSKQLKLIEGNKNFESKNSGIFNPMYLCLNKPLYLPQDKVTLPLSKYETGKLTFGDGNPAHKEYNSLADFCIKGDNLEIRIPWQLLNVMDPSSKKIMDDLYKGGIKPVDTDGIYFGGLLIKDTETSSGSMALYSWNKWETPTFHERLKPSYYILKSAFSRIGGN